MNFRVIGKIAGGLFFPLFVSLFIISASLVQITGSSVMEKVFVEVLSSQVAGNEELAVQSVKLSCAGKQSMDVQFSGGAISVDCSSLVRASSIGDVARAYLAALRVKTYQCSFIDCLNVGPGIVLTNQGNSLLKTAAFIFLALSIAFGAVLALSLRGFGIAKGIGAALLSVGIMYFPTRYMPINLPFESVKLIIDIFASSFLYVLLAGVALMLIGFAGEMILGKKKA